MMSVEIDIDTIRSAFGVLCTVIVFMTAGFIYIFRKMEKKLELAESTLQKYIVAYARLEQRYKELKTDHEACIKTSKGSQS